MHSRVPLPYAIDQGLDPFLSPNALRTIAIDWQQGVLTRLNELVRGELTDPRCSLRNTADPLGPTPAAKLKGTDVENLNVLQTVKQTATDPAKALAFNYASEALNNSFFLSTLVSRQSPSRVLWHFSLTIIRALARTVSNTFSTKSQFGPVSQARLVVSPLASRPHLSLFSTCSGPVPIFRQLRLARDGLEGRTGRDGHVRGRNAARRSEAAD